MTRPLQWLRHLAGSKAASSENIPVLAIGIAQPEHDTLTTVAAGESWSNERTATVDEAINHLTQRNAAVILLDRDGCGTDWRVAMERLSQSSPAACILLISRVNDDYLWQEVVQRHGFDVISKPFSQEQLRQCVNKAWLFWKAEAADPSNGLSS